MDKLVNVHVHCCFASRLIILCPARLLPALFLLFTLALLLLLLLLAARRCSAAGCLSVYILLAVLLLCFILLEPHTVSRGAQG